MTQTIDLDVDVVAQAAASGVVRRVLHVGRVGFIGGAENILLTSASGLKSMGFEALLACPEGPLRDRAESLGVTTIPLALSRMRISINPLKLAGYLRSWRNYSRKLEALCRQHDIGLLHVHHPVTALYCSRVVKRLGLPLVFHLHEGPPGRPLYKLALKQAARLATRIICVSAAGKELLALAGADQSRSQIIHNGVRDEFIRRSRDLQEPRDRQRGPRIAVIGMIEKRKGQDIFVQAAALVRKRHPDAVFDIIGDTPANETTSYKAELTTLIERLGLTGCVRISAYRDDILDCMLGHDIIVSSSIGLESLSLVMLEAMALGRVIVSSDIGGICEVVNDGVNGFIVEPGDARSLADGILRALDASLVDVGRAAAEKAHRQFTTAQMLRSVAQVYADAIAEKQAPSR